MSWYHFKPYVPVAKRRLQAEKAAKKLAGKGRTLAPVRVNGRGIAETFWGRAWCANLESYSDFANRLPRGRTYVRNGSVIDLQITAGTITALVQGSELYRVGIKISPLTPGRWRDFRKTCAGRITNLFDLLQGRLSKDILTDVTAHGTGLFPSPSEIKLDCSCPDWADMCKHVAAVLYGVGARLDTDPALFFTLRGVDMQELITEASATVTAPLTGAAQAPDALAGTDLSEIFGVEIDVAAPESPDRPPATSVSSLRKGVGARRKVPRKSTRVSQARDTASFRPATKTNKKKRSKRPPTN